MPDVREDMPQAPSALSNRAKAESFASEANALPTDCVTGPLSEHLPGFLRTGIPYPIELRLRPLVHRSVIRTVMRTPSGAKRTGHELTGNTHPASWLN